MARLILLITALAALLSGQERDRRRPPRMVRSAAWSSDVRSRLVEAKAAIEDARKAHRARLEETRAAGSHRKSP